MTTRILVPRAVRISRPASALALASLAAWMLGGCTNMSGLSGSSKYACKAPEGVTCDSVSGTYANALHNNLPSQRRPAGAEIGTRAAEGVTRAVAVDALGGAASRIALAASAGAWSSASPLRSPARILRLWFKPWEDVDRDLHDQGYVYIRVDDGQWLVEHTQRQIRDAYAPLRPPPRAAGGSTERRDASSETLSSRSPGPLSLPGLTPPSSRPQPPVAPPGND